MPIINQLLPIIYDELTSDKILAGAHFYYIHKQCEREQLLLALYAYSTEIPSSTGVVMFEKELLLVLLNCHLRILLTTSNFSE